MVQNKAILALILAIFTPLCSSNLIDDTCKQTPNPNLCASILKADPKSSGADVTGLALIMVHSLESKSNDTLTAIHQLLKTNPELKDPLNECLYYIEFIHYYDVHEAVVTLTKGNPKLGEFATINASDMAKNCENAFKSGPSPISSFNKDVKDVADIAGSIVRLLL